MYKNVYLCFKTLTEPAGVMELLATWSDKLPGVPKAG